MPPPQPVPKMTPNTTPWPAPAPSDRLGQREAVGVVLHPHLAAQQGADLAVERMAVQRDRVGVLHQSGGRADHAGNADADGRGDAELRFRVAHHAGDAVKRRVVAVRRVDPVPQPLAAVRSEHHDLDLGAAEVDADAMLGHGKCCRCEEMRS